MPNAVELVKQTGYSAAQSACQERLLQAGHRDEASVAQSLMLGRVNTPVAVALQKAGLEFVAGVQTWQVREGKLLSVRLGKLLEVTATKGKLNHFVIFYFFLFFTCRVTSFRGLEAGYNLCLFMTLTAG